MADDVIRRGALLPATALLTTVAVALRLPGLGPGELWRDDAWVALQQKAPLGIAWHLGSTARGFNALESIWLSIDPHSTTLAQAPIFLVAVLTIPVAVYGMRWASGSTTAGLITAAILATSPVGITYATRVKQYPLDTLLDLVMLCIGLRLLLAVETGVLDRRMLRRLCWFATASAVLSMSTAPVAATSVAVPLLLAFRDARTRPSLPSVAIVGVPAAALLLLTVFVVLPLPSSLHDYWIGLFPNWSSGARSIIRSIGSDTKVLFKGLSPLPPLVGLAATGFAVLGLAFTRRLTVAAFLLSPVAAAYALVCLGVAPLGGGRIDMWLYPALAMIIALGFDRVSQLAHLAWMPRWALPVIVFAGLLVLSLAMTRVYYPRARVKQQMRYIAAHRQPGDQIDVASLAVYPYALLTNEKLKFRLDNSEMTGFDVRTADSTQLLDAPGSIQITPPPACTSARRVWWVSTEPDRTEGSLERCGYRLTTTPVQYLDLWVR